MITSERSSRDGVAAKTSGELRLHAAALPDQSLLLLGRREGGGRGTDESGVASLPEGVAAEEFSQPSTGGGDSSDELSGRHVEQNLLQQLWRQVQQPLHLR